MLKHIFKIYHLFLNSPNSFFTELSISTPNNELTAPYKTKEDAVLPTSS